MLIVDDERHIVDFVAMGLEGMEVEGALDGREALLVVEEFRPDVICWTSCYPISRGSRSELRADDYLGNSNVVEAYVS